MNNLFTSTVEEEEFEFNLNEFVDSFSKQNYSYQNSQVDSFKQQNNNSSSSSLVTQEKINLKEKNYVKQKIEFESKFKVEINKKINRKTMDPSFYKPDSKFGKMMRSYFNKPSSPISRLSGEFQKVIINEGSQNSSKIKEEKQILKTPLKKLRHSINFSDVLLTTLKGYISSPSKPKEMKNNEDFVFVSPRDESLNGSSKIERQSSVVIETLKSTSNQQDLVNLFLPRLSEIPFTETEMSEENNTSNDQTFADIFDDFEEEEEEEDEGGFDHPDVLKLMMKK